MSDKTNEEKLRILQERLTTIKQKQISKQEARMEQSKPISPVFEEDLVSQENEISEKKEKGGNSFWKITFGLIFLSFTCVFGYYFNNNDFKMESTIENIKKDFETISNKALSLFGDEEDDDKKKKKKKKRKKEKTNNDKDVIYNKSEFNVNGEKGFIVLLNSYTEKSVAKAEVQKNKIKGYDNCGFIFLPGVSDSEQEIYQTFMGPFSNIKEANQWKNSSKSIKNSGIIIELQ
ncbi:MAG: SPOR domain-containing protein [Flavobacteriales bacterium]